jgi:hypothetical protein
MKVPDCKSLRDRLSRFTFRNMNVEGKLPLNAETRHSLRTTKHSRLYVKVPAERVSKCICSLQQAHFSNLLEPHLGKSSMSSHARGPERDLEAVMAHA